MLAPSCQNPRHGRGSPADSPVSPEATMHTWGSPPQQLDAQHPLRGREGAVSRAPRSAHPRLLSWRSHMDCSLLPALLSQSATTTRPLETLSSAPRARRRERLPVAPHHLPSFPPPFLQPTTAGRLHFDRRPEMTLADVPQLSRGEIAPTTQHRDRSSPRPLSTGGQSPLDSPLWRRWSLPLLWHFPLPRAGDLA